MRKLQLIWMATAPLNLILRACLLSGRQRRLVLYHKMYTFIFGYIKKAKRKKLPECIRQYLRRQYPDDGDDRRVLAALQKGEDDLSLG